MKVFDLTCAAGHRFEGWFASAERFATQCAASAVRCPLCDTADVQRAPSAPRLNLGGDERAPAHGGGSDAAAAGKGAAAGEAGAALIERLRRLVAATEDVGTRFAEEARRIHYAEVPARAIRGTASERDRRELRDEGIETLTLALPPALTETLQ